mmetsp:Transcript_81651/g.119648  ORF Transcript_81651/g.119648 Transcript_81651/m.119648 type:complete len:212 (+) Transcript_81651:490-1125(+)
MPLLRGYVQRNSESPRAEIGISLGIEQLLHHRFIAHQSCTVHRCQAAATARVRRCIQLQQRAEARLIFLHRSDMQRTPLNSADIVHIQKCIAISGHLADCERVAFACGFHQTPNHILHLLRRKPFVSTFPSVPISLQGQEFVKLNKMICKRLPERHYVCSCHHQCGAGSRRGDEYGAFCPPQELLTKSISWMHCAAVFNARLPTKQKDQGR